MKIQIIKIYGYIITERVSDVQLVFDTAHTYMEILHSFKQTARISGKHYHTTSLHQLIWFILDIVNVTVYTQYALYIIMITYANRVVTQ